MKIKKGRQLWDLEEIYPSFRAISVAMKVKKPQTTWAKTNFDFGFHCSFDLSELLGISSDSQGITLNRDRFFFVSEI